MLQRGTCPKFQGEIWSWCNGTFTPQASMLLMGPGRPWRPTWCTRTQRQVGLHIGVTPFHMCRPILCYILLHAAHDAYYMDSTAVRSAATDSLVLLQTVLDPSLDHLKLLYILYAYILNAYFYFVYLDFPLFCHRHCKQSVVLAFADCSLGPVTRHDAITA